MTSAQKRVLIAILVLTIGVFAFYQIENYRGRTALAKMLVQLREKGITAGRDAAWNVPPPDKENFYMAPVVLGEARDTDNGNPVEWQTEEMKLPYSPSNLENSYFRPNLGVEGYQRSQECDFQMWAMFFRYSDVYKVDDMNLAPARQILNSMKARFSNEFSALEKASKRKESFFRYELIRDRETFGRFDIGLFSTDGLLELFLLKIAAEIELVELEKAKSSIEVYLKYLEGAAEGRNGDEIHVMSKLIGVLWGGISNNKFSSVELNWLQQRMEGIDMHLYVTESFEVSALHSVAFLREARNDADMRLDFLREIGAYSKPSAITFDLLPKGWIDQNAANYLDFQIREKITPWRNNDFRGLRSLSSTRFPKIDPYNILWQAWAWDVGGRFFEAPIVAKTQFEIACAVERYAIDRDGEYPEKLTELVPDYLEQVAVDPFSGSSMKYRRVEDRYVIYSIGMNLVDDGGVVDRGSRNRRDLSGGDWSWNFEEVDLYRDSEMRALLVQRDEFDHILGRNSTEEEFNNYLISEQSKKGGSRTSELVKRRLVLQRERNKIKQN